MSYLETESPEAALKDLTTVMELDPSCNEATTLKEKAERAVCKKQETDAKFESGSKRISIEEVDGKKESKTSSALLDIEAEKPTPTLQTRVNKVQKKSSQQISTKESVPESEIKVVSERRLPRRAEDTYIPMRTGPMIIEEVVETNRDSEESSVPCSPDPGSNTREQAEKERTIGNEHFKSQDYCAAIKCYNTSLSLDPGAATTLANRALCYLKMTDWNTAISDCSEAINIDSGYTKAYYRRAMAFEGLGDLRGALKDLQAALKLQPDDSQIADKLKAIKRKLRVSFVKDEAETSNVGLEEISSRSPSMHEIKTQIGEGYYSGPVPAAAAAAAAAQPSRQPAPVKLPPLTAVPEKPRTAIEFQRSCERLQGQSELLRKFISGIHIDEYPGIFKENLSVEVLRIILKSLQAAFMPHDPAGTMAVLGGLVKVKRFGLILKLLSPSEKKTFLSIFDWLRDSCGAPLDRAQELKALFY